MRFHEFGPEAGETFLVVHPRCVTWDILLPDIKLLAQRCHVVVPVLPGHDFQDGGAFTSVERIAKEIEDWLIAHDCLDVAGALGFDIGGSILLRMIADGRVRLAHAAIDEGLLPKSPAAARLAAAKDCLLFQAERRFLTRGIWNLPDASEEERDIVEGAFRKMAERTVWDAALSCHSYALPAAPFGEGTTVEYWYATGRYRALKQDIETMQELMPKARIVELPYAHMMDYALGHARECATRLLGKIQRHAAS